MKNEDNANKNKIEYEKSKLVRTNKYEFIELHKLHLGIIWSLIRGVASSSNYMCKLACLFGCL